MATLDDIKNTIRLDVDTTGYNRAARLTTWIDGRVEALAPSAPATVKTRAAAQWVGYLFDGPFGAVDNAFINSGASALLRPWVALRARKVA